ncbi:MAG: ABC transporter substrate-binding protein [Acidimicrobiaceae bacterium]|nr:ABC transporter substrate-binding protein [Acidimicrobiaceae bacterium]
MGVQSTDRIEVATWGGAVAKIRALTNPVTGALGVVCARAFRGRPAGVLVLALLLTACGSSGPSASNPSKLTVGLVGANTADWPIFLAESQGYFKQNGVQVQEVITGGPSQSAQQLASGSLDVASNGTDSWIRAVSQHLPAKIIAPEFTTDPYALVTQPSITSWSQLKGKTVMLGTTTDVTAITFQAMASAQGLSQKDFTVVTAGSTNSRYAALKSGHVDAAMLTQPFDLLSESEGLHLMATAKQYVPSWIFTSLGANTNWLKSHQAEAVGFLKAMAQAINFGYAHPDTAVSVMAQRSKVSKPEVQKAYDVDFDQWQAFSKSLSIKPSDLQAVVQAVVKQGTVKQAPSTSDLYDGSYVQRASS